VIAGDEWASRGFSGTSAATAMAAGVAALVLSANPDLTWTEVRDILRETAVQIDAENQNPDGVWRDAIGSARGTPGNGAPRYSRWYGFGRINAAAAVVAALARQARPA
jgi:subtilisin family serine protease